ncbi:hypothetical protein [Leisingera caerulea]|uniref:hypothetical protein n=1 Tax=Leisingera caerulea TaxID=506591 RepID=UPI00040E0029|nr:hypothetical protein [Leisingera caerulea]
MAELGKMTVQLKILDLDSFKDLVEAIGVWAEETAAKPKKTKAESALFDAVVALGDSADQKAQS